MDGGRVTLSIGQRDGVVAGVELVVLHEGDELKHPKTGEVLGKKEETVGRVRVEEVAEAYSVARVTSSRGSGIAPGDKARVSAGKIRLTVLPLSTGVKDNLIEAAVQELVDGLTRTGRFSVGMGDSLGVALAQQGIKPEDALEGKGLKQVADRFKAENVLVVHFKRVETKPYMDVRLYELPRAEAALSTAFFVPPSIRPTTQGSRFSQGGLANPPQAKQRSLLSRLLGRELEAGSYSSGENSIPLKEVAKFPFAVVAIDVGIMPKDKIPRMVVSDGDKVYMYKVVGHEARARVVHVGALQGPGLLHLPGGPGRRRRLRGARQPARSPRWAPIPFIHGPQGQQKPRYLGASIRGVPLRRGHQGRGTQADGLDAALQQGEVLHPGPGRADGLEERQARHRQAGRVHPPRGASSPPRSGMTSTLVRASATPLAQSSKPPRRAIFRALRRVSGR